MKDYFFSLGADLQARCAGIEYFSLYFAGECSDFCRFNAGKIRQPGNIAQNYVTLRLKNGLRQVKRTLSLAGNKSEDLSSLEKELLHLKSQLSLVPEDPFILIPESVNNTDNEVSVSPTASEEIVAAILSEARGLDFVGILANGLMYKGFLDSRGQKNWFSSASFNLDWSLYFHQDRAVKCCYSGQDFNVTEFAARMKRARDQLAVVGRRRKDLTPGKYRAFLAPSAVQEILATLSWGSFGHRNIATKKSPLLKLFAGERALNSQIGLVEDFSAGLASRFDSDGFIKPVKVPLLSCGKAVGSLISARTAMEFDLKEHSGANDNESPESLRMNPGELEVDDVCFQLRDGLYINNLWYLNYSDRANCRVTGMTRFANFWIENGEVVAPTNVMRFDESVYRLFGSNLESLTKDTDVILSSSTYENRSTASYGLPGAIVNDFTLTL